MRLLLVVGTVVLTWLWVVLWVRLLWLVMRVFVAVMLSCVMMLLGMLVLLPLLLCCGCVVIAVWVCRYYGCDYECG